MYHTINALHTSMSQLTDVVRHDSTVRRLWKADGALKLDINVNLL